MIRAVARAKEEGRKVMLTPKAESVEAYNREWQNRLEKTTFADPGCRSWYKAESGRVTNNWPGTAEEYVRSLGTVRWEDYEVTGELAGDVRGGDTRFRY